MKKILCVLLLSLLVILPVVADDFFDDDDDDFFSYSNITTGYGALVQSGKVLNSFDLGFSFNFAGMNNSRTLGIGLGSRFDVLFGVGNGGIDSYLSVDALIGPFFHIPFNRTVALNLTVGPFFNFYSTGSLSSDEHVSIGPAVDCSVSLTPPGFDGISFGIGSLFSANISLNDDPNSFSFIPYVAFNIQFSDSYYPPYGALVIY